MHTRSINTLTFGSGLTISVAATAMLITSFSNYANAGTINYTLKTDIKEVHTGIVDGREYLTIEINEAVGPIECRSKVLRLNTDEPGAENIETVALSALMQQDQVLITVPLQRSDCLNGNPSIVEMYLLHNS